MRITLILSLTVLTILFSSQNGAHAVVVDSKENLLNSGIVDHSESSCQEAKCQTGELVALAPFKGLPLHQSFPAIGL